MEVMKKLGSRGQIQLGKQYSGRHALVEEMEPGVWTVKIIPDNERWLHEPEVKAKLERALAWAAANPPHETDLDELERKILGGR
jgi:hypothetical protein